jgi:lysophospholipase L1-like esterase
MNKLYIAAGVAAGALGLFYLSKKASASPAIPSTSVPPVILALGDSLTASESYCKALSEQVAAGGSVTCRGLPGQGTGAILTDLKVKYPGKALNKFTDVVVLAGVNDIASGRSTETIIHNLSTIYNFIKGAGPRVVAVQLTPWYGYKYRADWEQKTQAVNSWISNSSIPDAVVDTFHLGDFQGRLLEHLTSGDGLHLNKAGCHQLATLVMQQGF